MGSKAEPVTGRPAHLGRPGSNAAKRRLIPSDPAAEAGLVYTTDAEPGIRRVRRGKGFAYLDHQAKPVSEPATLDRIRSLGIPPAWTEVWICARPRGHLQATGRDSRGRKQHLYHQRWRETRDADKFARLIGFARALPRIRRRVAHDLTLPGLPREKVMSTIVRLLETTYARIGNEEYARQNKTYGLTTLRDKHVQVRGSTVRFVFTGKSGKEVVLGVADRRVAAVVKRCEELPGQRLFQYIDADGERRTVDSDEVNEYLREMTGEDYTAKDFRTWAATVLALKALREVSHFESETEAKRNVVAAIDSVAQRLGHSRTVSRRSYIHPAVIDMYLDGTLERALSAIANKPDRSLKADEAGVLALLKRRATSKMAEAA